MSGKNQSDFLKSLAEGAQDAAGAAARGAQGAAGAVAKGAQVAAGAVAAGAQAAAGAVADSIDAAREESERKALEEPTVPRLGAPDPALDDKEFAELDDLTARYEKMTQPGALAKLGEKAMSIVPEQVKDVVSDLGKGLTEQEIYKQSLEYITKGFKVLEEQAAKLTVSEADVIKGLDGVLGKGAVTSLEEVCLARGYDVSKAANAANLQHILSAFAEGGATGVAGFAGVPANLVLSTFLYYRAVQCIAMAYGYDVKNDPAELVIASEVFANAMNPKGQANEVTSNVAKIMSISAAAGVKTAAKKGWAAMIEKGGPALLIAQMRALANAAAKKALTNAGQKGLENSVFREVFEQVGKRLSLKAVQRAVPVVSAGIGALIDTAQMNTVLQYADLFYHKRFLLEKEARVEKLLGRDVDLCAGEEPEDAEFEVIDDALSEE